MFGLRIVPTDVLDYLQSRIKELEAREGQLLDRLMEQQGQFPVSTEGLRQVSEAQVAYDKAKGELSELLLDEAEDDGAVAEDTN